MTMANDDQRLPSTHVGQVPAWTQSRDRQGRLSSDPRSTPEKTKHDGTGMELPGADREWVPKVELPRGGGAIRPVGEKVEAQAFNGSASYSIALAVSPGRDGRGPALSLAYSSGGGNGPFGLGWSLSVPSITRKTDKRLPTYEDVRESDVFVLAGAEDLVPLRDEDGTRVVRTRLGFNVYPYRPRVEGAFARIERWVDTASGATHWRVLSPDGVTAWYGQSEQARIVDPEDPRRVFSWLLERTEDDRGHVTQYEYKAEEAQAPTARVVSERNRSPSTGRYLARVRYGNAVPGVAEGFVFEVVLDYGEYGHEDGGEVFATPVPEREWSLRADSFSSFRAGFDVRTRRLCRRVLMFHRFAELGEGPTLVRSTDFTYDDSEHLAKLVTVTQRAYERNAITGGYVVAAMPPLELSYSAAVLRPKLHELDAKGLRDLPRGIDGNEFRLADLEGDGLPGIVSQQGDVLVYKRPRGDGRYGPAVPLGQQTSTAKLGDDGQLIDVDADGRLELVTERGYYARTGSGGWTGLRSFRTVPSSIPEGPPVQRVDLDGDGLPEILVFRDDGLVWYPSEGREGYGKPRLLRKPTDERSGPVVVWQSTREAVVFADMTGDGLADIVRVSAGGVVYWPNLGYGKFGRRVTMDGRPDFGKPDGFDPRRLRLGDLDGSGTTDIIMLHGRGATVWLNQAGNRLSEPVPLRPFPGVSSVTAVEVVDLFGDGTAGLLWSTGSDWAKPHHILYLQVLPKKPHLLTEVRNGQGGTVRLQYESSARQALRDREAGRPWVTRLPFPVQVVTRIEQHDEVARRRFVQRCAYHHGCYDGVEREFRGFGFVERWDTEAFEDFQSDGLFSLASFDEVDEGLHQPPVLTRTWFHTGMYVGHEALALQHTREYWSGDAQAWGLPDTVLPRGLSADETLEAARALRGRVLREEVYALDGSELEVDPYSVTERSHVVRRVQRKGAGEHAVVFAHDGQTLTYHYERNPEDPRIGHALVLDVDGYGSVTRSAMVSWPRRSAEHAEQDVRTVIVSTASFAAVDDVDGAPDVYRAKMPVEARVFEALGLAEMLVDVADASRPPIQPGALRSALASATVVPPEAGEPGPGDVTLRLLSATRTIYKEENLTGPLPLGECGTRGFVHEVLAAAMSDGQVTAAYGLDVDGMLLADLGYVADDGLWWARSPQQSLDPEQFWQAVSVVDPFGGTTEITRDAYAMFVTAVQDPVGNVVTVEHDYRVLAPRRLTDPNGNRSAIGFDTRGMVVWTAVMGKDGASEGDTEQDPTKVLEYDLFAWRDRGEPVVSHVRSRETHGDPGTRWLHAYSYSDGFGGVLLEKHSAAPGMAPQRDANGTLVLGPEGAPVLASADPRWVGTGRVVLDNKGNPVRQYEPYFSSTAAYEAEAELREQGVTPVMHYDPLGRLVRTQWPDGTESRVEFSPWLERRYDRNDTVLGSAWHAERMALAEGDSERRAAALTEAHADTPAVAHMDALGRPFVSVEHNRDENDDDIFAETHVELDTVGNVVQITDARENVAEARQHGMLRQMLRVTSEDAGERRVLRDVMGAPCRAWNSRGFVTTVEYDAARRPLRTVVTRPDASTFTAVRMVYGESVASAESSNLRGRAFRVYDGAGLMQSDAFDFAGNLVSQTRQLSVAYDETPSWNDLNGLSDIDDLDTAAASLLELETFTTTATFDALGRPVTQTTPDDSVTHLGYDDGGKLYSVAANVRGAMTATDFVTSIEYDARGQRQRIDYGNGTRTTYEHDPRTFRLRRLHTTNTAGTVTHQDLRYSYDPVGNVTEIRDLAQPVVFTSNAAISADQRFTYDALYHLIEAEGREHGSQGQPISDDFTPRASPDDPTGMRAYTESYAYDLVGNLLEMQHQAPGGNWTRHYDYAAAGNRVLGTSAPGDGPGVFSHAYEYNPHGNMTAMPHLAEIAWDHADRMQSADLGGGGTVWFLYDSAGNRVRKIRVNHAGTSTYERIYVGGYEVYRERIGTELRMERQTLHVSDDTGRICLVETKTVEDGDPVTTPANVSRYQYGNHLDSVGMELDETGEIISYEEFHPYGTSAYRAASSAVDVSPSRYRYTGKERDEETGLGHHGVRYYASWLGRWTAADPIGLGDGVNRFAYAGNDPLGLHDPSGMRAQPPKRIIETGGQLTDADRQQLTTMEVGFGSVEVQSSIGLPKSPKGIVAEAVHRTFAGHAKAEDFSLEAVRKELQDVKGIGNIPTNGEVEVKLRADETLRLAERFGVPLGETQRLFPVLSPIIGGTGAIDVPPTVQKGAEIAVAAGIVLDLVTARRALTGLLREYGKKKAAQEGAEDVVEAGGMEVAEEAAERAAASGGGQTFKNLIPDDVPGTPVTMTRAQLENANNSFLYVVKEDGSLVIGPRLVGGIKQSHIDLAGGKAVRAAGEVKMLKGTAHEIDNWSGHYKPSGGAARNAALEAFEKAGYNPNRYREYTF
jgi:RHS repeat-associated protein